MALAEIKRGSTPQEAIGAGSLRLTCYVRFRKIAEDLSYSHTSGWTETKSGFLSTIESKAIDYVGILPSNLSCRLHNKTAIIIGDSAMSLLVQGEPLQLSIRFLDVSYEVDGAWFLIAWQSVRLKDE